MENVRIQKIEETENQTISTNEIAFSYIFNEYLKNNNFIEEKDFAKEIQNLSLGNNKNILKIAKVLITYTEKNYKIEPDSPLIGNILAREDVNIKKTQANKYIAVYKYCSSKHIDEKSTEKRLKLGIEKLYLITKLEDKEFQEKLEEFVSVEKLNVNELDKLIKIQNKTSKILDLSDKFNKFKMQNDS